MKRLLSLLLCAAMLCGTLAVAAGAVEYVKDETFVLGDADGDGTVNAKDALSIKATIAGVEGYKCNSDAADIDADGTVSARDTFFLKGSFTETINLADYENGKQVYKFTIGGNDISKYTIQIPEGSAAEDNVTFAAETLSKFVAMATGTTLNIVYGEAEGLRIAFHPIDTESEKGEQLGHDGYIYEVKDGNMDVYGTLRGNMYAVFEILEDYLGFRFYDSTGKYTFIFKTRTADIAEGTSRFFRPSISVRSVSGPSFGRHNSEEDGGVYTSLASHLNSIMQGRTSGGFRHGGFEGEQFITSHSYSYLWQMGTGVMPDESYGDLAARYQAKLDSGETTGMLDRNPCASSEESYEILFDGLYSWIEMLKAREWYTQPQDQLDKGMLDFCFSSNDTQNCCTCKFCAAKANGESVRRQKNQIQSVIEYYGGDYDYVESGKQATVTFRRESYSGVYLDQLNRAAADIQEFYPNLRLYSILYYHEIPESIRPTSLVDLQYCGPDCNNHGLGTGECTEEGGRLLYGDGIGKSNRYCEKLIARWAEICEETGARFWFYYYPISYYSEAYSTPCIFSMFYDIKFIAGVGCHLMLAESTTCTNTFETLKAYLLTQLMWNSDMTMDEYIVLIKEFLYMEYGAGWQEMYDFLMMYEEAGDKTENCFLNNFDRVGDMFSYYYLRDNYETMRNLLLTAEEKAETAEKKAKIRRMVYGFDYLGLSAVHLSWYTEGDSEHRALYEERYTEMFNYIHANKIRVTTHEEQGYSFPSTIDFTVDPMTQVERVPSRRKNSGWENAKDEFVQTNDKSQ